MVGMQVRLTCDRVVDATYIYLVEAIGGGAVVQTEASVLELDMPSARSKPFRGEVAQGGPVPTILRARLVLSAIACPPLAGR